MKKKVLIIDDDLDTCKEILAHAQSLIQLYADIGPISNRRYTLAFGMVRTAIDRAVEQQAGTVDPRRSILDKAMDSRIKLLQQQVVKLKQENETLKKENQKLQKALNKKSLNILKGL